MSKPFGKMLTKWHKEEYKTSDLIKEAPDPKAFQDYLVDLIENDCDKWCIGIDYDHIGFMQDYHFLSKLIPYDSVVVDVGCSTGMQHVLFKDFKKYIGIDSCWQGQKAFTPNAEFIIKEFTETLDVLDQYDPDELFGIANMSLYYFPGKGNKAIDAFKKRFHKLFIR